MDEGVRRIVNIPVRQRIFPMRSNAFEEGGNLIDKLASVSDTVELKEYGKQWELIRFDAPRNQIVLCKGIQTVGINARVTIREKLMSFLMLCILLNSEQPAEKIACTLCHANKIRIIENGLISGMPALQRVILHQHMNEPGHIRMTQSIIVKAKPVMRRFQIDFNKIKQFLKGGRRRHISKR